MTTPNFDVDFGTLPQLKSYAARNGGSGLVRLDGIYVKLPEGVSTITVGSQNTAVDVYLSDKPTSSARYVTKRANAGGTVVFTNVAVPAGTERYLSVSAATAGDVGVTIITWPLATN